MNPYDIKTYLKYRIAMLREWVKSKPVETKKEARKLERQSLTYTGYLMLIICGWAFSQKQYILLFASGILCIFSFLVADYYQGAHRGWNRERARLEAVANAQKEAQNGTSDNSGQEGQ